MKNIIVCAATGENVVGVPEEVKLIPLGQVRSQRGDFLVDKESYRLIREQFKNRKLDLVIDYEHQTLKDVQAPASGWIKDLRLGDDAIIGKVEWTDQAKAYLAHKEYRYLSPVIIARKSDKKVIGLHSAALTNTPAIDGMFAIVNSIDAEDFEGGEHSMELKELIGLLGLQEDATKEDVLASIRALLEKAERKKDDETEVVANSTILSLLGLGKDAKTEDVLVKITALKAGSSTNEEIMELKKRLEKRDAEDAVQDAMKEGKISAAMKEWAEEYALKDPKGFQAYVEKAPVLVPVGKMDTVQNQGTGASGLDEAAAFACKQLSISEDDIKKYGGKE